MVGLLFPSSTTYPGPDTYTGSWLPGGASVSGINLPTTANPNAPTIYTCVIYKTVTGRIVAELPLAEQPQWSRQLNQSSQQTIKLRAGDTALPPVSRLRELVVPWFFSAAVLWGTHVCQAGPVLPYNVDDTSNSLLQLGTGDFWSLLSGRLLANPAWNPATTGINTTDADVTVTDTLANIALQLVRNAIGMTYRAGSSLPVDIPTNTGSGTITRTYFGYDMNDVATKLHELTQEVNGPDIDFQPYLYQDSTGRYIRHLMRVGRDTDGYLVQPGTAPVFDYGSSLRSIPISGDGSKMSTTSWTKGSGDKYSMLYGMASDTTLTDAGWPLVDAVDSSHISSTDQTQLSTWATANQALHGKATEQWTAYVDANTNPQLGSYAIGYFGTYNINGHIWLPDQQYSGRILGIANGRTPGEVVHTIEGRGPF